MFSFEEFLLEEKKKTKEMKWVNNPKLGWWKDNDPMLFFHGTHKKNLEGILESGIYAPKSGPTANWVSLALDPYTSFGYASMTGGESAFRAAGARPTTTPPQDRVIFFLKIPKAFILQHMNKNLRGNMEAQRNLLIDKSLYEAHKKKGGKDYEYYAMTEVRLPNHVDSSFIKGYMFKVK